MAELVPNQLRVQHLRRYTYRLRSGGELGGPLGGATLRRPTGFTIDPL